MANTGRSGGNGEMAHSDDSAFSDDVCLAYRGARKEKHPGRRGNFPGAEDWLDCLERL